MLSGAAIALLLSGVVAGRQVDNGTLLAKLLGRDVIERHQALDTIRRTDPDEVGSELRGALISLLAQAGEAQAQRYRAARAGEELTVQEDPELLLKLIPIVAALRDPRSIEALTAGLGMAAAAREALAALGEQAIPALVALLETPDSRRGAVNDALVTLRFIVEESDTMPLSENAYASIVNLCESRLATSVDPLGNGRLLRTTIDLAVAVDVQRLRRIVELLATDANAVAERGVRPEWVAETQRHAADRLAGIPPQIQREGLNSVLERSR